MTPLGIGIGVQEFWQKTGGALWLPTELPILEAWWRADLGVSTDGDGVYQWDDQSGNGHTLTQSTGAKKPGLVAGVLDGFAGVDFDGIDDGMGTAIFTSVPQAWAVYAVVIVDSTNTGDGDDLFARGNNVPTWYYRLDIGAEEFSRVNFGSEVNDYQAGVDKWTLDDPEVFGAIANGASSKISINMATTKTGNAGANALNQFHLGYNGLNRYTDGSYVDVLILNDAPSGAQEALISAYFASNYPTLGL
jgi:hypothetical protein